MIISGEANTAILCRPHMLTFLLLLHRHSEHSDKDNANSSDDDGTNERNTDDSNDDDDAAVQVPGTTKAVHLWTRLHGGLDELLLRLLEYGGNSLTLTPRHFYTHPYTATLLHTPLHRDTSTLTHALTSILDLFSSSLLDLSLPRQSRIATHSLTHSYPLLFFFLLLSSALLSFSPPPRTLACISASLLS